MNALLQQQAEYLVSDANDDTPQPPGGFPNSSLVIRGMLAHIAELAREVAELKKALDEARRQYRPRYGTSEMAVQDEMMREDECNCDGGEQGEGLVSVPHEPTCPRFNR